jgi:hypothetical protein
MPVVEVRDHGLWLLAKNVSIYRYKLYNVSVYYMCNIQ